LLVFTDVFLFDLLPEEIHEALLWWDMGRVFVAVFESVRDDTPD